METDTYLTFFGLPFVSEEVKSEILILLYFGSFITPLTKMINQHFFVNLLCVICQKYLVFFLHDLTH